MSMEKHKCKLCSRKFSSGKAMGGHMRSHLRALPLPPKTPPQKQDSGGGGGSESTLSVYSEEEEEKHLGYGLRENPKKSSKIVDPEFLDAGSVVHEKYQSETESTKKPTKRRSKRTRRMFVSDEDDVDDPQKVNKKENKSADFEPVSSFSDSSPEEDIAVCLMMLSKDVWRNSDESRFKDHKQGKYQCEVCSKVLKSSQALGSHKTIHKKNISSCIEDQNKVKSLSRQFRVKDEDQKVHECPFCGKIFGSGQALGGHKRSHILLSSSITGSSSSKVGDNLLDSTSAKLTYGFIDLNMPAPMEDEDFSIS
ncbi:unnamed protein product [Withania somnifera]